MRLDYYSRLSTVDTIINFKLSFASDNVGSQDIAHMEDQERHQPGPRIRHGLSLSHRPPESPGLTNDEYNGPPVTQSKKWKAAVPWRQFFSVRHPLESEVQAPRPLTLIPAVKLVCPRHHERCAGPIRAGALGGEGRAQARSPTSLPLFDTQGKLVTSVVLWSALSSKLYSQWLGKGYSDAVPRRARGIALYLWHYSSHHNQQQESGV